MGYGTVSRLLHWITAVLVILMVLAGLIMTQQIDRSIQDPLFAFHKGTGALLILIVGLRILWRLTHPAPPMPSTLAPAQRMAAHVVHYGLYVFLVVMIVSGYVRVIAGGFPIEWLNAIGVPPLLPRSDSVAETAKAIHATAKYGLIALIVAHVGAAAMHGLFLKDGVFSRMWPPVAPGRRDS